MQPKYAQGWRSLKKKDNSNRLFYIKMAVFTILSIALSVYIGSIIPTF